MLAVGLGLLVAATYGSGDFFGGLAARRLPPTAVVLWSQLAGLLGLVVLVPFVGGAPTRADLATGAIAGPCGLVGVVLLYRGLAVGRMAVVAPTTAVGAALVPFVAGLVDGDRMTLLRVVGAVAALAGVVLVSVPAHDVSPSSSTAAHDLGIEGKADRVLAEAALAIAAGLSFGVVFVLLARASGEAGVWPVVAQRCTSVAVGGSVLALVARRELRPPLAHARILVLAGLCDAGANGLFLVAAASGDLSVVGVVSSLYPAATVLLAALVLHERIASLQALGLAAAGAGVVLLAL